MLTPNVSLTEPCSCGSGKKYKNCCWKIEKRDYAIGRRAVADVIQEMIALLIDQEDSISDCVAASVWEETCDCEEEEIKDLFDSVGPFLRMAFADIAIADFVDYSGANMIDSFLSSRGDSLNTMAREFLTGWRNSSISLFEVLKVEARKSLTLRDVFTGEEMLVSDKDLSDIVSVSEAFFARVVPVGKGYLLSPGCLPVDPNDLPEIIGELTDKKSSLPGMEEASWNTFFKDDWEAIPVCWIDNAARRESGPQMVNTDGDPIYLSVVKFHLRPGSDQIIHRILRGIPDLVEDSETSFRWVVDKSNCDTTLLDSVTAAHLTLSENLITAQVNSMNRAAGIEILLAGYIGNHITNVFQEEPEFDPDELADREEIPLEIRQQVVSQFLDEHYMKWLDIPVPMLSGKTPREAVSIPSMRGKVVQLLDEFEASPPMNGVVYDYSWIRRELQL